MSEVLAMKASELGGTVGCSNQKTANERVFLYTVCLEHPQARNQFTNIAKQPLTAREGS